MEATPALAPRLPQAYASLSAAHKMAGDQPAAEACLERLISSAGAGAGGEATEVAAAEAAENLGTMLLSRGEEARGTAQLAAAYALRRGLLAKGAAGCSHSDVQRARLLLGMARAEGMREAFVSAVASKNVDQLIAWKEAGQ